MADPKTAAAPATDGAQIAVPRPASEVQAKAAYKAKKKTGVKVKVRAVGGNIWLGDRVELPDGRVLDTHKLYVETEVFMVDESELEANDFDKIYETRYEGKYPGVYRRRGQLQRVDPSTPLGVPPPPPKKNNPFRNRR